MLAGKVIVEVIEKADEVMTYRVSLGVLLDLCEIHADLWKKVGRMPVACFLSGGTARVIFQSGRRATDSLDSLGNLVQTALEGMIT